MNRANFLSILREIHSQADEGYLLIPIYETSLDSMDLLELRSRIETNTGKPVPDELWFKAETLDQLLQGLS